MSDPNAAQRALWNDLSGPRWVELQPRLDAQLAAYNDLLLAALGPLAGARVLDVGCGCGATTLALARAVTPAGRVVGVDLSEPMLARARERVDAAGFAHAGLVRADAQVDDLPGGPFDALASRFGVMFFADPRAAFARLHRQLAPGARVAFACWQRAEENAWVTVVRDAALTALPAVPLAPRGAPGPFAFAEPDDIRAALGDFAELTVTPHRASLPLGGGGDLDGVTDFALQVGPIGSALREASPAERASARAAVRAALEPHARDGEVSLGAAAWIVTARA